MHSCQPAAGKPAGTRELHVPVGSQLERRVRQEWEAEKAEQDLVRQKVLNMEDEREADEFEEDWRRAGWSAVHDQTGGGGGGGGAGSGTGAGVGSRARPGQGRLSQKQQKRQIQHGARVQGMHLQPESAIYFPSGPRDHSKSSSSQQR